METWVLATVKKKYVRRLSFCALAAVVALLFAIANYRYVVNFLNGPFPMNEEELLSLGNASSSAKYYVRVSGSNLIKTGLQEITITKRHGVEQSRSVTATYYALLVGRHALIVKTSSPSTKVEGALKPITDDLRKNLQLAKAGSLVYPFYIDTESFRTTGYWCIAAYLILFVLLAYYGLPAWRKFKNLNSDPVVKRVASWGDVISLSGIIEKQYSQMAWWHSAKAVLSRDYIFENTFFTFNILRFDDLLWAYKRVIKKRVNFIPTGKDYEAILICYGGSIIIKSSENEVHNILRRSAERAPWAVYGYSKDIEEHFRKYTKDFCIAVEAKRKEINDSIRQHQGE